MVYKFVFFFLFSPSAEIYLFVASPDFVWQLNIVTEYCVNRQKSPGLFMYNKTAFFFQILYSLVTFCVQLLNQYTYPMCVCVYILYKNNKHLSSTNVSIFMISDYNGFGKNAIIFNAKHFNFLMICHQSCLLWILPGMVISVDLLDISVLETEIDGKTN